MVGELILLPLRVGVRATRLWFRVAEEGANMAANVTGRLIGLAASRGSEGHSAGTWTDQAPEDPGPQPEDPGAQTQPEDPGAQIQTPPRDGSADAESAQAASRVSTIDREAPATTGRWVAPPPPGTTLGARHAPAAEPVHVSEEPELVEEIADPGAEEGAGPEIHIDEPWEGYAQLNAKQVIARLSTATSAALAAVQLYESSHRRRQTILNAVQRELRSPNGSSSRNQ